MAGWEMGVSGWFVKELFPLSPFQRDGEGTAARKRGDSGKRDIYSSIS
jgi:hypothetical protein